MTDRKPLIAGNWKMHMRRGEAALLAGAVAAASREAENVDVAVFPPFTAIDAVATAARGSRVIVGGQACHYAEKGAHTGEISAGMLLDAGCTMVLCGHSERRAAGVSDEGVGDRVRSALAVGLRPIICCGETLEEREAGQTAEVLLRQMGAALDGIAWHQLDRVDLAYEPVWAIGTGRTATPQVAEKAHATLRKWMVEKFERHGEAPRILYGGSVKPSNAKELLATAGVNGVLVGGAALDAGSFREIMLSA